MQPCPRGPHPCTGRKRHGNEREKWDERNKMDGEGRQRDGEDGRGAMQEEEKEEGGG